MSDGAELTCAFPTPILTVRRENGPALALELAAPLLALREKELEKTGRGVGPLWQSGGELHLTPEFAELVRWIDEGSTAFVERMGWDCGVRITSCWANIVGPGGRLIEHTHANNFISGIFYVRIPEESGATYFQDPRPQVRLLLPSVTRPNALNALEHEIGGEPGRMVLFPSWLAHGVSVNRSTEERITISFNLMLHGRLGSPDDLAFADL